MKAFMNEDFLLENNAAKTLYHEYAENMPIVDYHCHVSPREIAEDKRYESITELWLGGDHYKWRVMRSNGVPETEITGDSDPYVIFENWIKSLTRAIGNPLYHWSYLELKRYFAIENILSAENARDIYDRCNEKLKAADMSVRGIIKNSGVKLLCTTDDPIDDLRWHKVIAEDDSFDVQVLPAMRPDKALNIEKPEFADYIAKLGEVSGVEINSFAELKKALGIRIDFFRSMGGRVSDHALDYPVYAQAAEEEIEEIFKSGISGQELTELQRDRYKTALLIFLAGEYKKRDWVMQIHFGCIRGVSEKGLHRLGPDTGFDCAGNSKGARELAELLAAMESADALPKLVLYSLNQYDNETIMTIAGSFLMDSGCKTRIQLGSAWWFNDTKTGMEKQLTDFANLGVLGNFIGMLTDSRSFISYTRHEYFRRILCNTVGTWMEKGELPDDFEQIGALMRDISYNNAVEFFGFEL